MQPVKVLCRRALDPIAATSLQTLTDFGFASRFHQLAKTLRMGNLKSPADQIFWLKR